MDVIKLEKDSERSDECIDFTMIGCFRWQNEYPRCIIELKSKKFPKTTKSDRKREFQTKSMFLYSYNSKTNYCKCLKLLSNVYMSVIYTRFNFQNIMASFELLIDNTNFRFSNLNQKFLRNLLKSRKITSNFVVENSLNYLYLYFSSNIDKIRQNHEYLQIILSLKYKPPFSTSTGKYIIS
ncbi:hypothetical protein AGLY_000804 [Aphis glycines]|uniref:Uncharacterized protein n=1 Tax=Aphis glycines TaxID=307491 RepID=A0A6G0U809_APHGL|nr:hypothetical protein AGLY_000804 [Aphis glycines]